MARTENRTVRRRATVVLTLAMVGLVWPQPLAAQAGNLPADMFGILRRPLGAIFGTVDRIGRQLDPRQRVAPQPARPPAAAARPRGAAPMAIRTSPPRGASAATPAAAAAAARSAALAPGEDVRPRAGTASPAEPYRPAREPSKFGLGVPALWPTAFEDAIGYSLWPTSYDRRFRAHGIADVLGSMFVWGETTPQARRVDMAHAQGTDASAARSDTAPALGTCAAASPMAPDWPASEIVLSVNTTRAQRLALDRLRTAVSQAVATLRATCRDDATLGPVERLRAMQNQLWAVQEALSLVRGPLAEFYDTLSDDQRRQFLVEAPVTDPRAAAQTAAAPNQAQIARLCGMPPAPDWPIRQIAQALRPTEAQRASLEVLRRTAMEMGQLLLASCMSAPPATPVARLDAAADRLTAVVFAAANVALALNDFYGQLSDEQKAKLKPLRP